MEKQWRSLIRICLVLILAAYVGFGCGNGSSDKKDVQESTAPATGNASADENPSASDVIIIKARLWPEHTKEPVRFTHERHHTEYGIACDQCHHVYENGKNVWQEGMEVRKCQACHNEPTIKGETKLPTEVQKKNLKLAFHNNCRSCHRDVRRDNPDSKAPVICSGCHVK